MRESKDKFPLKRHPWGDFIDELYFKLMDGLDAVVNGIGSSIGTFRKIGSFFKSLASKKN